MPFMNESQTNDSFFGSKLLAKKVLKSGTGNDLSSFIIEMEIKNSE